MLHKGKKLPLAANIAAGFVAAGTLFATAASAQPPDRASIDPPWQHGENNDAVDRGLEFTVPGIDSLADFHGDLTNSRLVLFVGGNYYFAMAPLVRAFEEQHPDYRGRIYWETLPPGLLVDQIKHGGRVTSGNMTWQIKPDAYFAGLRKIRELVKDGTLTGPPVPYVTNTLSIMVPRGNPGNVHNLADLGRPDIRLAMPNPEYEGIARQIKLALAKTGGPKLADAVYGDKVRDGTTQLTRIHHRQTPLFLMQQSAQAGVTWQSEAIFQEQIGNPIAHIDIPAEQNATAIYAGATVNGANNPDGAKAWLDFIRSPEAMRIFARYGFKPYAGEEPSHE